MDNQKQYICIDLKSFYASVECVEMGLNPLTTNLVVADSSRTEKTICLAVTPALKAYGISGRARLFEVVQKVREINRLRLKNAPGRSFSAKSVSATELEANPSLELDYIAAPPRMAYYMEYSTRIYDIYLKYVSHDDILVYSVDEVFIDATGYLKTYKMTARELAMTIIRDVLKKTGITATAGIGTNMYLAKIAMDVMAKKMPADSDGVRIAELDEMSYRRNLWTHRPLTDFWRIGAGYSKKLEAKGLYTMGDIARASVSQYGEDMLYKLFGINAELLIDHAWGYEPCTLADAKAYKPENKSISTGQVLHCPYDFEKAKLIVREMLELLALDLVEKRVVTDQIVLTVGYDIENLTNSAISMHYEGEITTDFYGRKIPKHAHGTANLGRHTSSGMMIIDAVMELFDRIVNKNLLVRRVTIAANHIIDENSVVEEKHYEQLDFFTDYEELSRKREQERKRLSKERKIQEATVELRQRFGKNAVLKGTNLKEGGTTIDRNRQIGGHKA
ncbi:MAG: DNA methylase [Ruminococcaceae bacterium]|nr:DNA methylase [Oscillospiraceae bacterium]